MERHLCSANELRNGQLVLVVRFSFLRRRRRRPHRVCDPGLVPCQLIVMRLLSNRRNKNLHSFYDGKLEERSLAGQEFSGWMLTRETSVEHRYSHRGRLTLQHRPCMRRISRP